MKPLLIAQLALAVLVIVLAFLQLVGVWENAICVYLPLAGVLMLIQAFRNWKTSKGVARFSLFTALFLFVTAIFIFFL